MHQSRVALRLTPLSTEKCKNTDYKFYISENILIGGIPASYHWMGQSIGDYNEFNALHILEIFPYSTTFIYMSICIIAVIYMLFYFRSMASFFLD